MSETILLALALFAGILLGGIFFGGLLWTIHKGFSSKRPVLWFIGSLMVRISIVVSGFYFVAYGHWERLLICLLGFIIARYMILYFTRATKKSLYPPREEQHAS